MVAEQYELSGPEPSLASLHLLSDAVLKEHLGLMSSLDRNGLLNTLVPNHVLPLEDPARALIEFNHKGDSQDRVDIETGYDLGVVFGRQLAKLAEAQGLSQDYLLPVISPDDENRKKLVESYLNRSKERPLKRLILNDNDLNINLPWAIDAFSRRCELVCPDKMLANGREQVQRGVHDYLSVITLLETPSGFQKNQLRRQLGAIGLAGLAGFITSKVLRRHKAKN